MIQLPHDLAQIDSVKSMLDTFELHLVSQNAARFAVLPLSEGQSAADLMRPEDWGYWELLREDPFLCAVVPERNVAETLRDEMAGPVEFPVLFISALDDCLLLCSVAHSDLFRRLASQFFFRYFPRVGRAFWDTSAIFAILEEGTRIPAASPVHVTEMSFRNPINSFDAELSWETQRRWTNLSLHDAHQELVQQGAWARSVSFEFRWRGDVASLTPELKVEGSISRNSIITARSGASVIWKHIVSTAADRARERRKVFEGRQRGDHFEHEPRPLLIQYEDQIFEDVKQNRRFIARLHDFPESCVSIYHGNPHIHAAVVDYLDGSTFNIWVVSTDRITIVPGARATVAALERLSSHIMDQFREGEILDADGRAGS